MMRRRSSNQAGVSLEDRKPSLVLGTVYLDEESSLSSNTSRYVVVETRMRMIKDIASLNEQLPKICTEIFQRIGSQQLEATYQRCLKIDLEEIMGVKRVEMEPEIHLLYKGQVVGTRRADLWLELESGETAIIELKAVNEMNVQHMKQLQYYMHHANVNQGYLINFPHDDGFPNVEDRSKFRISYLWGFKERIENLLMGGLWLRNAPEKRQVEVLKVTRRTLSLQEQEQMKKQVVMVAAQTTSMEEQRPRTYGITKNGTPCKICLKKGGFCHLHQYQRR